MENKARHYPAKCCLCGERVKSAPFIGDIDCAFASNRPCPHCQGVMYLDIDGDQDREISDSCWSYGINGDNELLD